MCLGIRAPMSIRKITGQSQVLTSSAVHLDFFWLFVLFCFLKHPFSKRRGGRGQEQGKPRLKPTKTQRKPLGAEQKAGET